MHYLTHEYISTIVKVIKYSSSVLFILFWARWDLDFYSKENQTSEKKQTLHVTFIQNSFFLKKEHLSTQTIMPSLFLSPALHL